LLNSQQPTVEWYSLLVEQPPAYSCVVIFSSVHVFYLSVKSVPGNFEPSMIGNKFCQDCHLFLISMVTPIAKFLIVKTKENLIEESDVR
jgi:hypothetical protein